jgi:hypothetical protein
MYAQVATERVMREALAEYLTGEQSSSAPSSKVTSS